MREADSRRAQKRVSKEERGMIRRFGLALSAASLMLLASPLMAMAQTAPADVSPLRAGLVALAANIGIGIAAFGSAIGQGRMVASAMESIGRNPNSAGQIFTPMIIGLAFIEALTLYALVIAFFLQAKI
jgi:F-type H+-transporting ATPase subunit c